MSGGAYRAMIMLAGTLQQLHEKNVLGKIDYLSAVSGGTYAASIFTYYQQQAKNDSELLGPFVPPYMLTAEFLSSVPMERLIYPATLDPIPVRNKLVEQI